MSCMTETCLPSEMPPEPRQSWLSKDDVVLHMFCGKIASGKSTLAAEIARRTGAVLISEDEWLGALFGTEMQTVEDYIVNSARLRNIMGAHLRMILSSNVSVVLDFPANTVKTRNWMREIIEDAGVRHCLHVIDIPDETCKERLHVRNAGNAHEFSPSDDQFDQISSYFCAPTPEEGFEIVTYEGEIF